MITKFQGRVIVNFIMAIISIFVVVFPLVQKIDVALLFITLLIIYGTIKIIDYLIDKNKYNYIVGIICLLMAILYSFLSLVKDPFIMPFHILAFMLILSGFEVLKLEDRYLAKKEVTYNLLSFFIIITLGIFTSAMIFFSSNVVILGFYFLVISCLNFAELFID